MTNNGPEPDTGVQLVETNRTPALFTSIVMSKGTFDEPSRVWTIGDLAAGESATIAVQVHITRPELITNRTVVFAADLTDPNLVNNEATATLTVPGADLAVTKTVDQPTATVGTPITFTIGVSNNGPDTAFGTTVVDNLPAGVNHVSSTATSGLYDPASGEWTVGDLAPGDGATLTIVAMASVPGTFANTAVAAPGTPTDIDSSNNSATAGFTATAVVPPATTTTTTVAQPTTTTSVPPSASSTTLPPSTPSETFVDLSITKTASTSVARLGSTVRYTIIVTNNGDTSATGTVVTDEFPAGLEPFDLDDRCSISGATVTCALGSLSPGETVTLQLAATITDAGSLLNTATVSADQSESSPSNNQAGASVVAFDENLPASGGDAQGPLTWAVLLTGIGSVVVLVARRSRLKRS